MAYAYSTPTPCVPACGLLPAGNGLRLLVALDHSAIIGRCHRVELSELFGVGSVPGAMHLAGDRVGAGGDHASLYEAGEGRSRCELARVARGIQHRVHLEARDFGMQILEHHTD